ncbi:ABC transporter, transmembrane region [Actinomycetales bacterium JB111]|nr:ABC transporter, transmembrane region [Actinomycetales bacterium JB111]
MRRIGFHSPEMLADIVVGPTAWLRFWFPDPDDPEFEHQRGYTIVEPDEAAGTFTVDFVMHEPVGPASAWAKGVEVGASIQVTTLGSYRFEVPADAPAGFLVIGDAASLPAINGILGEVPHDIPLEVYLEKHAEDDLLIPLVDHPRATIRWVTREDAHSLAKAIERRDWSNWYAWAAPESGSLKQLRPLLKETFGFPKTEIHAQAYWIEGRAFGSNRNKGQEKEAQEAKKRAQPAAAADDAAQSATVVADQEASARDQESLVAAQQPAVAAEAPASTTAATTAATAAASADAGVPAQTTPAAPASADSEAPAGTTSWRSQAGGKLLAPLKRTFWAAGILQALITLVQLAPFVLLVELARRLLVGSDPGVLWTLGIWAVGLLLAGAVLAAVLMVWLHAVDAGFERDVRSRLLAKLGRLPLGWFDAKGPGGVKSVVQDDTVALHYLITHAVPDAVGAAVGPVAVLVYLFVVDWRIALLLLVPVLVYVFQTIVMLYLSGARPAEYVRWTERMNSEADAYLEGQSVVRVFGGAARSSFRARLGEFIGFIDDWQRPLSSRKTVSDLATRPTTFLLLIAGLGTLLVTSGRMAPVDLLPFLLLGTTFGARLLAVGYGLSGLRDGLSAARRIQVVLDETELRAPDDGPVTRAEPAVPTGRVEIDAVDFEYRPGLPVLSDISLTLEPGTVTALVGPSGSGKSTLASLIARFYDVTGGAIRIGGTDIRDLTADELYARVGFVLQDTQLVRGTVAENIALGRPDATADEIEKAARAAQIHERIVRLPRGYDTPIAQGAALSGGERQRLTIARAILADAPVLVLDEATAFADPESEYQVQRAIDRLTAGRTVLVIAHRLHTVRDVDRIVVLDGGRVAESGTHDDLLAADGRYAELWTDYGAAARGGDPGSHAESSSEPRSAKESVR